ncbi:hypothetical protein [Streptomyces yerevanensis]|uniref:hypothetical protein n=1 Tax=Streptomyces yerevanensis TaxID=66378 RepID=UPI000527182F|nr:hypothetical protein [Streptomyces yerevanensis]
MTPEAQGPFNRRVRLVVEVRDDQDELELANSVFAAQGWGVRPARDSDSVSAGDGYTGLIVEIPVHGSRWTARSAAVEQLTSLAKRRKIDLWVRETKLVPHKSAEPQTTYHVHRRVPDTAGPVQRWLAEHWIAVGGLDVRHTLHLRGAHSDEQRDQALAELEARNIGGPPFDPDAHDIRLASAPRASAGSAEPHRDVGTIAVVCAIVLVCCASGIILGALTSVWRFAALLIPAAISWPVGVWMTSNAPRPRLVQLGFGVVLTGSMTFGGWMWGHSEDTGLSRLLPGLGIALGIGLTAFGLWYALSASWFSRNVQWFLPVLAAPLPFVMPWVGSLLHAMYLEEMFGIPAGAVHVGFYWQYAIAARPLTVAVLFLLVLVAVAGWARHFNVPATVGGFFRMMLVLAGLIAVLTVVQLALGDVEKAADRTMDAAAAGRRPPAYFGIRAELVCVEPVGDKTPVINGPVPTAHPVLSFQASGDTVWLWDPAPSRGDDTTRHALRVRAEDVALVVADGRRC